jgi:hypothetical protein
MVSRLVRGGVLGMALVAVSAGAYAQTIGNVVHPTLAGEDFLDDLLGDLGGFLVGLLGFLV